MAKKMMARTRLEKADVFKCVFCNFEEDVTNAYENKRNELTKKIPRQILLSLLGYSGKT